MTCTYPDIRPVIQRDIRKLPPNWSKSFAIITAAATICPPSSSWRPVIHLRTLRRVNGVALCLIDHYFTDLQLWPVLQTFTHGSLHDLLRDRLDIELTRVRTKISARRAQAKESNILGIPNMAPLLCVRTLNHRQGEQIATEYSVSLTRADMIEFTMEH